MPQGFRTDGDIDIGRCAGLVGNGKIDMVLNELKVIAVVGRLAAGEKEEFAAQVGLFHKAGCSLGGFLLFIKAGLGSLPGGVPGDEEAQIKGIYAA